MSSTPSQRWLRRSSGRLRVIVRDLMKSSRALPPGMRITKRRALLDREIGGADDLLPLRGLVGEEGLEIVRRAGSRDAAEIGELLEHALVLERCVDFRVELVDDLLWCVVRNAEAEERARLVARDTFG